MDPSDVVQETLARAYEKRHQFLGATEAEFRSWVLKILASTLKNLVRDQKRLRRHGGRERSIHALLLESSLALDRLAVDLRPAPHQCMEAEERALIIAEAMLSLPPRQMEAFILSHLRGWKLERIASALGLNENACSALLFRARTSLARELKKRGMEAPGRPGKERPRGG